MAAASPGRGGAGGGAEQRGRWLLAGGLLRTARSGSVVAEGLIKRSRVNWIKRRTLSSRASTSSRKKCLRQGDGRCSRLVVGGACLARRCHAFARSCASLALA